MVTCTMFAESGRCPICLSIDNEDRLGDRTFYKIDGPKKRKYVALRYKVMFEVWWPHLDRVTINYTMCRECGFIKFDPRPTTGALVAKYRYLAENGEKIGHAGSTGAGDALRGEELFKSLQEYLGQQPKRVLDVGGGDGRLLRRLIEAHHDCFVVDYNEHPINGVSRLGATVEEIPDGHQFDVITCLHVLEHLSEPRDMMNKVAKKLRLGGLFYAEVPLEVWDGAPVQEEPVTHVNFFTRDSMNYLMSVSGLQVSKCYEMMAVFPNGRPNYLVRVTAIKTDQPPVVRSEIVHTRKLVSPSLVTKFRRAITHPTLYARAKFRRHRV